jgi:hypothetical protein
MIRLQRSRKIKRHNKTNALEYAKKIAGLANNIDNSVEFKVFIGLFCSVETVFWIGDFEGLASLEITLQKIESDPRWKDFFEKTPNDIFVEGSAQESVMQLVS